MLDFDPLYSTPRLEAIQHFINSRYPLASPVKCRLLQRGMNDVYLAEGADEERYVFRLSHPRARGPADVDSETAFVAHLAAAGVPVAAPVPARDGALFAMGRAPEGVRPGVLFRAVKGRDPSPNDANDARANGHTLALLHNAAASFYRPTALYRLDLDHLLHRPLGRIRDSGLVEEPLVLKNIEAIAERTATAVEAFDNLTWTYCHGDCHGFNARIDGTGEAIFFDFDDSGPGYLAYDLSVFLWAKVSFGRQLTAMWDAFVSAYRMVRPIKPEDYEAAIRFVIVRHIWLMGEYASRASEWGSNGVGWIAREANFLESWEARQHSDRLL